MNSKRDDVDPDVFFAPSRRVPGDRKVQQLCARVKRVLSYTLSDGPDELLSTAYVEAVIPFPSASRLLVQIQLWDLETPPDRARLLERLRQEKGRLRSEIAASIHRKRTPELVFELAAPREEDDE